MHEEVVNMPDINAPSVNTGPALLLIEPEATEYSERAAQLDQSHYRVTRADNPRDIFLMRSVFSFSVAVLSDMVGSLALRASAQVVRGQWPRARILILGKAPKQFEDHLYDETVLHGADRSQLVSVIKTLTYDPWNQRGKGAYAAWLVGGGMTSSFQHNRDMQESDPTKVSGPGRGAGYARDLPAAVQRRHGGS